MREEAAEEGGTEAGSASVPTTRTRSGRLPVIPGTEPSADEVSTYARRECTQCRPARWPRVRRFNPSSLTRRRRIQSGPGPLKRNDSNRSDPNRASRIVEHQNIRVEKIRQNHAKCDEINKTFEKLSIS